ncbi:MAG: glycosyltransferase family 1 protein [Candidatus Saccharimonadales bacterium]
MKKLLIEASVLEQDRPSGVNYFTDGLAGGIEAVSSDTLDTGYFWLNFLRRKKARNQYTVEAEKRGRLQQISLIPQKIYAKLVYFNIAPPLWVEKSDWLLFPNFYIWPTFRSTKKAVIIHDLCFLRYPEYVEDKNRQFLEQVAIRSMKEADLIISNSEFTTSELIAIGNVPEEKIVTINIPVDTKEFLPELDKGKKRLTDRYNIHKPYILWLGNLEPRKNLNTLVNAYCQLPESLRDTYSLVLVGKWGWKAESLRELIDKRQSKGFDIITTGHIDQDDKATFYYQATAFAITTHYEGFGMQLLEALHCGVPSVAVDIPVLREVGGDSCLWVEKSVEGVSQGLNILLTNETMRKDLSERGKRRASTFSWEKTARVLVDRLLND